MNAVVSGRAAVAFLLQEDGKFFSIHQGDSDQVIPRRAEEFSWLLGDATDLEFFDGVVLLEVPRLLDFAAQREEALDIALILLDGDLPDTIRKQAAEDLEECFLAPKVQNAVEAVLYAAPLPEDADLESALRNAATQEKVLGFMRLLCDQQPIIRIVRQAWEAIEDQHFGSRLDRRDAQALCIRAGLFRHMVQVLGEGNEANNRLVELLTKHSGLARFEAALLGWGSFFARQGTSNKELGPGSRNILGERGEVKKIVPFLNEQGREIGKVLWSRPEGNGIIQLFEKLAEPLNRFQIRMAGLSSPRKQAGQRRNNNNLLKRWKSRLFRGQLK